MRPREVEIRCDELPQRKLITLLPQESVPGLNQMTVPGLKSPIRVWLRPGTPQEGNIDTFSRRMIVRKEGLFLKRSDAWRSWTRWVELGRVPPMMKRRWIEHMCAKFGPTFRHKGEWGWLGIALADGKTEGEAA